MCSSDLGKETITHPLEHESIGCEQGDTFSLFDVHDQWFYPGYELLRRKFFFKLSEATGPESGHSMCQVVMSGQRVGFARR